MLTPQQQKEIVDKRKKQGENNGERIPLKL